MVSKKIGFIGIENYDVIIYLSRVLVNLGKKVLLIDRSDNQSLTICIPHPKEMDTSKSIVNYRGIDFTKQSIANVKEDNYDITFIYFGLYNIDENYRNCDNLIYVSDLQLHHINLINEMINYQKDKILQVVIKDFYDTTISEKRVFEMIDINIPKDNKIILYMDSNELKYRGSCQEGNLSNFNKISKALKEYVITTLKDVLSDINDKELTLAYKKAERGN